MRRESVAGLRVRNFSPDWGLRGVPVKGGKTRDIPLPTVVRQYLGQYIDNIVAKENDPLTADTPIFWSDAGVRADPAASAESGGELLRIESAGGVELAGRDALRV